MTSNQSKNKEVKFLREIIFTGLFLPITLPLWVIYKISEMICKVIEFIGDVLGGFVYKQCEHYIKIRRMQPDGTIHKGERE